MITWRTVESSNVSQVGWPSGRLALLQADDGSGDGPYMTGDTGQYMYIRFKNGQAYAYVGVSRQRAVFIATRCKSVGSYVNTVVKTRFPSLRIPSLDVNCPPF